MPINLCVFCSSSEACEETYSQAAVELGVAIGRRGDTLIYGGTNIGLMGTLARATRQHHGRVVGVLPQFLATRGLAFAPADEMIITRDLRERKARMEERADAFLALPGGFGTLEEMLEIIALKQLRQHSKPLVFLNTAGFYDPLARLFQHMLEHKLIKAWSDSLYHFSPTVEEACAYLDSYQAPILPAAAEVVGHE